MSSKITLRYVVLDVFTDTPYLGNPLAIVHIPPLTKITQEQKQLIAREFNLSETVFIHEDTLPKDGFSLGSLAKSPVVIDIFITDDEIPFAGHPTVGAGNYLLNTLLPTKFPTATFTEIYLQTKAGIIPVKAISSPTPVVRLRAPSAFKIHKPSAHPQLKPLQTQLTETDYVDGSAAPVPVVSIVKGMTFFLLGLSSEDALARLEPTLRLSLPAEHLGEWAGPVIGLYAYVVCPNDVVRTRFFHGSVEDAATGSAASALCGYLCQQKGPGKRSVNVVQGVEMGRKSEITVVVDVDASGEVKDVFLEGGATQVMHGELDI
jgi:PhzF family phenazine biosynthesis protein